MLQNVIKKSDHIFSIQKKVFMLFNKHIVYSSFTDRSIKRPLIFPMCRHLKCRCCHLNLSLYDLFVIHVEK